VKIAWKSPGCKHPMNDRRFLGGWYLNTPGYIYIFNMEKSPFFENLLDRMLARVNNFQKRNLKYIYCMYTFITSSVNIFFFILLKNIKLALCMQMYIVHLYGGFYTQLFLGLFFRRLKLLSSNYPRLRTFF